jgi:kinetochore protein Mis12/MTW1
MPITLVESGKRKWETSQTGYMNWAVEQLVERTKRTKHEDGKPSEKGSLKFDVLSAKVEDIGSPDEMRGLMEADAIHKGVGTEDRLADENAGRGGR